MLNRRDFLTRLSALSAGALLPLPALAQRIMKKSDGNKILIAGAGIAGLYAADLLLARGYEVELVEALDRVGGKLMGGTVAGFPFDFGGQGFSREMKRVNSLGKRLGLTRIHRPEPGDFFLEGNSLRTGADYEAIRAERIAFDDKAAQLYPGLSNPAKRTEWQAESVMDFALGHFSPSGIDYFRTNFASEWCALPEEVSLLHFLEIQQAFEGDEADEMAYRYREGFSALATHLAHRLGDRIRLSSPLESVTVRSGGVSAVAGAHAIEARALVLAVPLPVVPKIRFAGFDTAALDDALFAYGGCGVRKVLLVYDRPFWGTKARDGEFSRPCGMSMLDNSDLEKKAYSLVVFLGGPAARDNPGRESTLQRVAAVLGEEALHPIGYHEQAWLDAEYLPGGYASNRVPTRGRGSGVLPTSLAGSIFLAGSETADHFPTYVEGALSSAERAVAGVVRSLERKIVLA